MMKPFSHSSIDASKLKPMHGKELRRTLHKMQPGHCASVNSNMQCLASPQTTAGSLFMLSLVSPGGRVLVYSESWLCFSDEFIQQRREVGGHVTL